MAGIIREYTPFRIDEDKWKSWQESVDEFIESQLLAYFGGNSQALAYLLDGGKPLRDAPDKWAAFKRHILYVILAFLKSDEKAIHIQLPIEELDYRNGQQTDKFKDLTLLVQRCLRFCTESGVIVPKDNNLDEVAESQLTGPYVYLGCDENFNPICAYDNTKNAGTRKFRIINKMLQGLRRFDNDGRTKLFIPIKISIYEDFPYTGSSQVGRRTKWRFDRRPLAKLERLVPEFKAMLAFSAAANPQFKSSSIIPFNKTYTSGSQDSVFVTEQIPAVINQINSNEVVAIVGDVHNKNQNKVSFRLINGRIKSILQGEWHTRKLILISSESPEIENIPTYRFSIRELHRYCCPRGVDYHDPVVVEFKWPEAVAKLAELKQFLSDKEIDESLAKMLYHRAAWYMQQGYVNEERSFCEDRDGNLLELDSAMIGEIDKKILETIEIPRPFSSWNSNPEASVRISLPRNSFKRNVQKLMPGKGIIIEAPYFFSGPNSDPEPLRYCQRYSLGHQTYCLFYSDFLRQERGLKTLCNYLDKELETYCSPERVKFGTANTELVNVAKPIEVTGGTSSLEDDDYDWDADKFLSNIDSLRRVSANSQFAVKSEEGVDAVVTGEVLLLSIDEEDAETVVAMDIEDIENGQVICCYLSPENLDVVLDPSVDEAAELWKKALAGKVESAVKEALASGKSDKTALNAALKKVAADSKVSERIIKKYYNDVDNRFLKRNVDMFNMVSYLGLDLKQILKARNSLLNLTLLGRTLKKEAFTYVTDKTIGDNLRIFAEKRGDTVENIVGSMISKPLTVKSIKSIKLKKNE